MELVEVYRGNEIYKINRKGITLYKCLSRNSSSISRLRTAVDEYLDDWMIYYTMYKNQSLYLEPFQGIVGVDCLLKESYTSRAGFTKFDHYDKAKPEVYKIQVI